jgi:hypothetical protein
MSDEPLQPSQEARACAGEIAQMLFDPNPHPQQLEGWAGLLKGAHDDSAIVQALARFEAKIRADQRGIDAIAARDAMVDYEWPPQDGDQQIDTVLAAIRKEPPHAN